MPHPTPTDCTRCARPGQWCWACDKRRDDDDWHGTGLADLCWHAPARVGEIIIDRGVSIFHPVAAARYPLCETCAQRWRSYREPARLHSIAA